MCMCMCECGCGVGCGCGCEQAVMNQGSTKAFHKIEDVVESNGATPVAKTCVKDAKAHVAKAHVAHDMAPCGT
jgi:hypothetical protein